MTDTFPPKDVLELLESCYQSAKQSLENEGVLRPLAILFNEADESKEQSAKMTFLPAMDEFNEEGKDHFATIMKLAAICTRADAIAFTSEAWGVLITNEEEQAEYDEYKKKNYSLEHFRLRRELVIVQLESYAGKLSAQFEMLRDGKNVTLAPRSKAGEDYIWNPVNEEARVVGRFVNLLPPPELRDDEDVRKKAQLITQAIGARWMPMDDEFEAAMARGEKPWESVLQ